MAPGEQDIERGFGTGLRAQLEARRENDEPETEPEAPEAPAPPPAAEVAQSEAPAAKRSTCSARSSMTRLPASRK